MSDLVDMSEVCEQAPKEFTTAAGLAETIALFNQPLSAWLPDVRRLEIHTGKFLPRPVILDGLKHQTDLRQFHSSIPLRVDILLYLSGLPHLSELEMCEESNKTMANLTRTLSGSRSFASLESLDAHGKYTALETFIPLITSECLNCVYLDLKDFHPLNSGLFSSLLAPPTRTSTLHHFELRTPDFESAESKRHALFSMATFAPFYDCINLETFDLDVDALRVEFHDADVEKMANAWPRLKHLRVFSRYTQQYAWADPDVHLYTLWRLAEKCPRLQEIAMPINAQIHTPFVPPPESDPELSAPQLHTLCFFLSPCAEGPHVAAFISRAFPNVEEFSVGNPPDQPEMHLKWDHVRRTIHTHRSTTWIAAT